MTEELNSWVAFPELEVNDVLQDGMELMKIIQIMSYNQFEINQLTTGCVMSYVELLI